MNHHQDLIIDNKKKRIKVEYLHQWTLLIVQYSNLLKDHDPDGVGGNKACLLVVEDGSELTVAIGKVMDEFGEGSVFSDGHQ